MTAGEIALLVPLGISSLGSMIALFKMTVKPRSNGAAAPNCQPCNESVDRLCSTMEKSIEKQDRILLSIERFVAKEEGRQEAMARTAEFPVQT